MNNQILNKRWNPIDKLLNDYLSDYLEINSKTQDNIQSAFEMAKVAYSNINNNITKREKQRLDRRIVEWQEDGLLKGIFGYESRKILNRTNVSYSEMFNIMLKGYFIEENESLPSEELFKNIIITAYNQGLDEIKPRRRPIIGIETIYLIMNLPLLDATATAYLEALSLTNAEQIHRTMLTTLQQGRELNINSHLFQRVLKKQRNRLLASDGLSGGISDIADTFVNEAMLQAGKDTGTKQCKFISKIDGKETIMCNHMNNMIFNIDDYNIFDRYYATNANDAVLRRTKVFGMVSGINLPPISSHFHWCRSTITYLID